MTQPMTAHWGVRDPAEAKGSLTEIALAFKDAYRTLFERGGVFMPLPIVSLHQLSLQQRLKEIARMDGATKAALLIAAPPVEWPSRSCDEGHDVLSHAP
jgi:hypothetical protein